MSNTNDGNDQSRRARNNGSSIDSIDKDISNSNDYNDIYLQLPPADLDQLLLSPPCSPIPVNWEQQREDAPHLDSFELELQQQELLLQQQEESRDTKENGHDNGDSNDNDNSQTKKSSNNGYIRRGVLVSNNGPKITIDCYL